MRDPQSIWGASNPHVIKARPLVRCTGKGGPHHEFYYSCCKMDMRRGWDNTTHVPLYTHQRTSLRCSLYRSLRPHANKIERRQIQVENPHSDQGKILAHFKRIHWSTNIYSPIHTTYILLFHWVHLSGSNSLVHAPLSYKRAGTCVARTHTRPTLEPIQGLRDWTDSLEPHEDISI